MNNLNSVLVEGKVSEKPKKINNGDSPTVCMFYIESNLLYKKNDEQIKETSKFEIEVWGKLAETCIDCLQEGRGVRVVGRLKQEIIEIKSVNFTKIKILAEHVDFKPLLITEK